MGKWRRRCKYKSDACEARIQAEAQTASFFLTRYMRPPPELVEAEQELFELPPRERVYYTKEVQTTAASTDEGLDASGGVGKDIRIGPDGKLQGLSPEEEKLIKERFLAERDEVDRLRREEEDLEKEIEEDIRGETG